MRVKFHATKVDKSEKDNGLDFGREKLPWQ